MFPDRVNLPSRDPVGPGHGRSSCPHRWTVSSPRCSPCRHHSWSTRLSESSRERNPQHGRRNRWDQHTRHDQSYSAGHRVSQHQSPSEVRQPRRDGLKYASRNPSGSRRVFHIDPEGVAARRGNPGERQRQHTNAPPTQVGLTAAVGRAAEDQENRVEVLRISHRELTQMAQKASQNTNMVGATPVLPRGYHNFRVQVPGSGERRPIPVVVSIPRPAREPVATVSAPQHPAWEPVATVSAPQHPAREPVAKVSAPQHPAREPVATVSAPQHPAWEPVASVSAPPLPSPELEASAAQKPSKTTKCSLCGKQVPNLRRHVQSYHLPWYFIPELTCCKCQQSAYNLTSLLERHVSCGYQGHVDDQRYLCWLESMKAFLDQLTRMCGYQKSTDLLL